MSVQVFICLISLELISIHVERSFFTIELPIEWASVWEKIQNHYYTPAGGVTVYVREIFAAISLLDKQIVQIRYQILCETLTCLLQCCQPRSCTQKLLDVCTSGGFAGNTLEVGCQPGCLIDLFVFIVKYKGKDPAFTQLSTMLHGTTLTLSHRFCSPQILLELSVKKKYHFKSVFFSQLFR